MPPEHRDVLIIGAGLSGIGAAYHLQQRCPKKTFALLEAREALGGTWDLFRYPGVRSDSDMFTLGYSFRPWTDRKAIASGATIRQYLRDTATEAGIDRHIRYSCRVVRAEWSSARSLWTVTVVDARTGGESTLTCSFLLGCTGYYAYEAGYAPTFEGAADFAGRVVHPQHWPEDLDPTGQRVIVIGSGATAVTLVPELARRARHVTMLQRTPTYIVSVPSEDAFAIWAARTFPARFAHALVRWKNVLIGMLIYALCRRFPEWAAARIVAGVEEALGSSEGIAHFRPAYRPWDQRLCLVPDGDLFEAIKAGKAEVVTDRIARFTSSGVRLESGRELPADVIVTATGLELRALGGATLAVDGVPVDVPRVVTYRGSMCSGVPNFAFCFGYTNASWTLKCELTSQFVCRVLNHLDASGCTEARPRWPDASVAEEPLVDFSSGYVRRGIDRFPRQGSVAPFRLYQNYALDLLAMRHSPLEDGVLLFSRSRGGPPERHLDAAASASMRS